MPPCGAYCPWGDSMKKKKTDYAHNPHYCMIMPDSEERDDEDIASTGQS